MCVIYNKNIVYQHTAWASALLLVLGKVGNAKASSSGTSNRERLPRFLYMHVNGKITFSVWEFIGKNEIHTMLTFSEAVVTCMTKKFFAVSGRATRAEYWWFQLFIIGAIAMTIFLFSFGGESTLGIGLIMAVIIGLVCFIPNFCVGIRRLHDSGHSGYYILWNLIPYVGWLIPFIATLSDSDGDNEYGPNPLKTVSKKEYMQNTSQKDLPGKQNDEFEQRDEGL